MSSQPFVISVCFLRMIIFYIPYKERILMNAHWRGGYSHVLDFNLGFLRLE